MPSRIRIELMRKRRLLSYRELIYTGPLLASHFWSINFLSVCLTNRGRFVRGVMLAC
jgi:hypothetical protein